jgi:hypothetical protein
MRYNFGHAWATATIGFEDAQCSSTTVPNPPSMQSSHINGYQMEIARLKMRLDEELARTERLIVERSEMLKENDRLRGELAEAKASRRAIALDGAFQ